MEEINHPRHDLHVNRMGKMKLNLQPFLCFCLLFMTGCAFLGSENPAGNDPEDDQPQPTLILPTFESEEPLPTDLNLVACPEGGGDLYLKFSAAITMQEEGFTMTHLLQDGLLTLNMDASGNLRALEPPQIPYTITGNAGECSLNGEGIMTPDATGDCSDGVVHLIIVEDWQNGNITVTCEDQTSTVPLPSLGSITHTGADGRGEVFYLDRNFTEEELGAGYTTMRPFVHGEGEHIWTLYMPDIPTVPLVP